MTDEFNTPEEFSQSAIERVTETIQTASQHVSDAIETGRRPGMPLDVLAKLIREAPLPSLAIAFLLGAAVFRRR